MKDFPAIDRAKDCLKEYRHHVLYAGVGIEQLHNAVQNNNLDALHEIVLMLILD